MSNSILTNVFASGTAMSNTVLDTVYYIDPLGNVIFGKYDTIMHNITHETYIGTQCDPHNVTQIGRRPR